MPPLDHGLLFAHPQLVVLDTLAHTLHAARVALASVHPEIGDDTFDLGDVDDITHHALLLACVIPQLDKLLVDYRAAVDAHWHAPCDNDLPF